MEEHSKEIDGNSPKSRLSANSSYSLFKCLECFLLPIREKLLTESQPNIGFMARSKQHIYNPYSDVNECIGIDHFSLPVPVLNQTESNKLRLVT